MKQPLTEEQVANYWTAFAEATGETGRSSRAAVMALSGVATHGPQLGAPETVLAAWRAVATELAAHAVASYRLSSATADLARAVLHQMEVHEAISAASHTALPN